MTREIRDRTGRCIGRIQDLGNVVVYMNARSEVVARVQNGKTYDRAGRYVGPGDQGMRML
jgi:hypothetical protein